jgi:hypothetical protein
MVHTFRFVASEEQEVISVYSLPPSLHLTTLTHTMDEESKALIQETIDESLDGTKKQILCLAWQIL